MGIFSLKHYLIIIHVSILILLFQSFLEVLFIFIHSSEKLINDALLAYKLIVLR